VRDIIAVLPPSAREPLRLVQRVLKPKLTRRTFGPVIVIHRALNRLYLYNGARFLRYFQVATGQSAYPTPLGRFSIAVKWKNPWWYPPASPWAKGAQPIPPGPGNPLGTRWMGLTAPGVGIHGTPDASSIGYSVSHGCIRMQISQAEWLFNHVNVGTTVFIIPH
jgi:lipoprotein-anchoring transpeptidase ErfK/SrfK